MTAYSEIFYHLKPYIQDLIANISSLNGSGAPSPHDLQSIHHTGTIGDSQATQFLKTDGSRNLTGNLTVSSLVTIDGVDIDLFQGTYNTHVSGDGHPDYVSKTIARTISAVHTFSPASPIAPFILGANGQGQTVTGLRADQLNKSISAGAGLSGGGALTASQTLSVDQAYNFTFSGADTFTNTVAIQNTLTARDIVPAATDTYDLGTSLKLWRKGWLSELDAVLFAQNTITLLGGWFYVTKNEGAFPADVTSGATTINFGQSMTVGDFVVMRAAGQVEYISVGSLVSGTTYNVTRNLDGSGANAWVAGTPYAVLGQNGNGRIELNANSTPRISIIKQGASYNAQTETVRIGDLNGSYGISSELYGIGIGDYSSGAYLRHDPTNGFVLFGGASNLRIDSTGLRFVQGTGVSNSINWYNSGLTNQNGVINTTDNGSEINMFIAAQGNLSSKPAYITLGSIGPSGGNQALLDIWSNRAFRFGGRGIFAVASGENPPIATSEGYIRATQIESGTSDGAGNWTPKVTMDSSGNLNVVGNVQQNGLNLYSSGTWTPTFTGFSVNPSNVTAKYIKMGRLCVAWVRMFTDGTSNSTAFTVSAPFTADGSANMGGVTWLATDNGTALTSPARIDIAAGASTFTLYKTGAGGGWTNSGSKGANFVMVYLTT